MKLLFTAPGHMWKSQAIKLEKKKMQKSRTIIVSESFMIFLATAS